MSCQVRHNQETMGERSGRRDRENERQRETEKEREGDKERKREGPRHFLPARKNRRRREGPCPSPSWRLVGGDEAGAMKIRILRSSY